MDNLGKILHKIARVPLRGALTKPFSIALIVAAETGCSSFLHRVRMTCSRCSRDQFIASRSARRDTPKVKELPRFEKDPASTFHAQV